MSSCGTWICRNESVGKISNRRTVLWVGRDHEDGLSLGGFSPRASCVGPLSPPPHRPITVSHLPGQTKVLPSLARWTPPSPSVVYSETCGDLAALGWLTESLPWIRRWFLIHKATPREDFEKKLLPMNRASYNCSQFRVVSETGSTVQWRSEVPTTDHDFWERFHSNGQHPWHTLPPHSAPPLRLPHTAATAAAAGFGTRRLISVTNEASA